VNDSRISGRRGWPYVLEGERNYFADFISGLMAAYARRRDPHQIPSTDSFGEPERETAPDVSHPSAAGSSARWSNTDA
jgi:hypothetical protein